MAIRIKSVAVPLFTLLVGMSLGMLLDATFVRGRRERTRGNDRPASGRPPGLVNRLERVIEPRSAAQADSIRLVLQDAIDGNSRVNAEANERLRARNDTLRRRLLPMLDAEQLARLDRELARLPAVGTPSGAPPGRGGQPADGRLPAVPPP
jgi:hypothetical protein